jgi:hypothetical protein
MNKIITEDINQNLDEIKTPNKILKVGTKYPYEIGEPGGIMELLPKGGFFIKLVSSDSKENDISNFRYGDISFKILLNKDKVYMLIRFGKSNLLYEILFDPTLYPNKTTTEKLLKQSNLIYTVFIDKKSSNILGIKQFNFPIHIYQKLINVWLNALKNNNYSQEYQEYCAGFFSKDIAYWWETIL